MTDIIQRMIERAIESGSITRKQKEMIIAKAQKMGDDIEEVEIILEAIPTNPESVELKQKISERRRCPNCGAVISETTFKCPECGYTFQKENVASNDVRTCIQQLQEQLEQADIPQYKFESHYKPISRKATIISSFTLPATKEGLLQLLEFSYSNFISIGTSIEDSDSEPLRNAWYGKSIQALNALSRIGADDPEVLSVITQYQSIIKKEKKRMGPMWRLLFFIILLFFAVTVMLLVMLGFS